MLAALLLAGLFAAPLSSAALFTPLRRPRRVAGAWPATRRFLDALIVTAIMAAIVYAALRLMSVSTADSMLSVIAFAGASLAWLPMTRRWNARAHLAWVASTFLFVFYLAFVLRWTLISGLGPWGTAGGLLLWLLELVAAVMASAYLWELCDALGTERWRRRITPARANQIAAEHAPAADPPFVSLHVPAHNEPPEMVIETLESLLRIDYPRFEVIAIDDNSDEESSWQPVKAWCAANGVKFAHLENWPGYKSGALNYALGEAIDPATEIIGVVDSDYQIDPSFLRRCVPLFDDPAVGFIQAPQDYRDWEANSYLRRLYYSYKYFFSISQPSRNERDGAIFAGTMGLIRRSALEQVGGWDEWCITEDAELSLRLLRAGWSGLHVDSTMGRGVMPLTFEALKSQRYRWCFGGIQIMRMHLGSMLPGRRTRSNRLDAAQRWSYLSGAFQWYGDLLGLIFFVFLLVGAGNLVLGGGQLFRKLSVFLLATVPVLVILGLVRAIALLRRGTGATWRDAIGAFFIWQSTSIVVARASVAGLVAKRAEFLRTPKTGEQASLWRALQANWAESLLALLGFAGIVASLSRYDTYSGPLLAALLLVPTLGLAAAPLHSRAAQKAMLPPELAARRRSEWRRDRSSVLAGTAAGLMSLGAIGLIAVIATLLTAPSPRIVEPPQLTRPKPPSATSSPHPNPAGGSSPAPSSTSTGTPTPTPSAGSSRSGSGGASSPAPSDTTSNGSGSSASSDANPSPSG
jgi:cellulose synthase/poly-beta-1,6-N-acetylglucosamine synthase-like glycosyltransferase